MALDSITKSSRSSRNALCLSIIIIGAVAAYNWIVSPHVNYIQAAQKLQKTTVVHARKNKIISEQTKTMKKELSQSQDRLDDLGNKLLDHTSAEEFFGNIDNVARQSDCIVRSLNLSLPVETRKTRLKTIHSRILEQSAKLTILGNYKNIVNFMKVLQGRTEYVVVDLTKIVPTRDESGRLACDADIWVYLIEKKDISSHD